MSPLYTPTRDLALPSRLVRETVLATAAYGTVIDATGIHNGLHVGEGAQAVRALDDYLASKDAALELPDGSLPASVTFERPQSRREPEGPVVRCGAWTGESIARAIRRWAVEHDGEPPRALEWNPARAIEKGHPEFAERFEAGDWPHYKTVRRRYRSWGLAVRTAMMA